MQKFEKFEKSDFCNRQMKIQWKFIKLVKKTIIFK